MLDRIYVLVHIRISPFSLVSLLKKPGDPEKPWWRETTAFHLMKGCRVFQEVLKRQIPSQLCRMKVGILHGFIKGRGKEYPEF